MRSLDSIAAPRRGVRVGALRPLSTHDPSFGVSAARLHPAVCRRKTGAVDVPDGAAAMSADIESFAVGLDGDPTLMALVEGRAS